MFDAQAAEFVGREHPPAAQVPCWLKMPNAHKPKILLKRLPDKALQGSWLWRKEQKCNRSGDGCAGRDAMQKPQKTSSQAQTQPGSNVDTASQALAAGGWQCRCSQRDARITSSNHRTATSTGRSHLPWKREGTRAQDRSSVPLGSFERTGLVWISIRGIWHHISLVREGDTQVEPACCLPSRNLAYFVAPFVRCLP